MSAVTPAVGRTDLAALWRALPPLPILLRRGLRRFDARALRERQLLVSAVLVLALMLLDQAWLSPAYKAWRGARAEQRQARQALDDLQAQAQQNQAVGQARLVQERDELANWRARVRQGDDALHAYADSLIGPDQMLPLLAQLLARHGQLRLRSMQSLGRTDLLATAAGGTNGVAVAAALPEAAASAPPPLHGTTLYRHGVELSIEGGYADLLSYLLALEALPQRLLWGSVRLKVEQHPRAVLTLRLYTVSRERHFLEI